MSEAKSELIQASEAPGLLVPLDAIIDPTGDAPAGKRLIGLRVAETECFAESWLTPLPYADGEDNGLYGSECRWAGNPQWQIEAPRRIEIPEKRRERFGFAPLGPARIGAISPTSSSPF